jgi:hypothetical protein
VAAPLGVYHLGEHQQLIICWKNAVPKNEAFSKEKIERIDPTYSNL